MTKPVEHLLTAARLVSDPAVAAEFRAGAAALSATLEADAAAARSVAAMRLDGGGSVTVPETLVPVRGVARAPAAVDRDALTHSDGPDGRPLCNATDVLYVTKQRETVTCPACAHALGAASRQAEVDTLRAELAAREAKSLEIASTVLSQANELRAATSLTK